MLQNVILRNNYISDILDKLLLLWMINHVNITNIKKIY